MNQKHQTTLLAIFADPVRANIPWHDIESLLLAAGATMCEGQGSRVRFNLNGVKVTFHRPHPRKEADKGVVRSVRRYLIEAGVML